MFSTKVCWPSAPLTDTLVRNALLKVLPGIQIIDSIVSPGSSLVQWSSYDEIDHELVNLRRDAVLSSSYTFRKCLIRKHFLSRCISTYLTKNPDSLLKNAWPRTFEIEISFVDEFDEIFADELWELADELQNSKTWWILKPGMADRGNGIRLFCDRVSLESIFQEFEADDTEDETNSEMEVADDTGVVTSQLRHFVIQQYLTSPVLFDPLEIPLDDSAPSPRELQGHKFHLRAYCVASGALTVYLYDRVLALFSSRPYRNPDLVDEGIDLACHLTNTSLQTHHGEQGVRLLSELVGCHVLSSSKEIIRAFTEKDVAVLTSQMNLILEETFNAALRDPINFQPVPNAFELFGVDFLVTHSTNDSVPWQVNLLEVNAEPAIELTGPRLKWILEDLFVAMGEVCVEPFVAGKKLDDWPVGEVRKNLIKCLEKSATMSLPENAGPSTPSRKRSKWQDHDEEETQSLIQPRRVRPKRSPERSQSSASPAPTTLQPPTSTKPSHSAYVPPRTHHPHILPSRSVYSYERLNQIEEGSYGVVFRARDKQTGDIVALKKLKLDEEKNGFPITALREINALMSCRHENVVRVREVVVGDTLTQVFVVMDFIEHDLKSLLTLMPSPFLQSEVKTLMLQLLSAVKHCHSNWILHRDLKTSNLLMNNRGIIKVADFGLARRYGDPVGVGGMTQLVVTLWYRAPEILLGAETYSTVVDMWSVGCIFAELLLKEPLFQAKGELELISMIFKLLGPPTNTSWPGYSTLPLAKTITLPSPQPPQFRQKFQYLTTAGLDLMMSLLAYDPERRISAEEALQHPYFSESPLPKHPDLFGSFPSAAAGEKKRKIFDSPSAPVRAADYKLLTEFDIP